MESGPYKYDYVNDRVESIGCTLHSDSPWIFVRCSRKIVKSSHDLDGIVDWLDNHETRRKDG